MTSCALSTVALALGLTLAGCTEPYGICRPGNTDEPGPGCALPMIEAAIDGDAAEWSPLVAMPTCWQGEPDPALPPCRDGYIAALQLAREPSALVFHLAMASATTTATYRLEIYEYWDLERYDLIAIELSPSAIDVSLNGFSIGASSIEQARGVASLEARVPFDALPFPERGSISTSAIADEWVQDRSEARLACWDARDVAACRAD